MNETSKFQQLSSNDLSITENGKIVFPDKELHRKFVILGNNRRKLTNELLALLPEIYEKGIYKKYSATIVEYAGKFGGLSKGVVMKRLRLEKHLKDKPNLKEAIRTEGVHKVALIAKLATAETENAWVDKLKNMSKASLFELAKEVREKNSFCKAAPQKVKIELEGELLFMFLKMKKKYGKNLSNREVMNKILETAMNMSETKPHRGKVEESLKTCKSDSCLGSGEETLKQITTESGSNISPLSEQKVQIFPGTIFTIFEVGTMECENLEKITKKVSRYIRVKIKKFALSSTNGKCSYPGCENPAENLHHPERFAKSRNHNNLKPLCKIHHEFMHNGLVKNEQNSIQNWQLDLDGKLNEIDNLYRKYRSSAMRF